MCTVGNPGKGPGGSAPLFFAEIEARRADNVFFGHRVPPPPPLYLRVWMTGLHRCPKDVPETS